MNKKSTLRAALAGALCFSPLYALACASCGCSLSSDWETLGASSSGLKMDLRYDYLDQDQLRAGTDTITPEAASRLVNANGRQEVEQYTRNDYLTLGLNYSFNPDWGVAVQLPYIDRSHGTLGTASDGITGGPGGGQYLSHTSSLGDVKVVGHYQGFDPDHTVGILFGLKLPTGDFTKTGVSTDPTEPGPAPIDRGLQPGSGTTDLILGAYRADELGKSWDYFLQAMAQTALDARAQYRPGDSVNLTIGLRYSGFADFAPQLQINARHVATDSGANADIYGTGGTLVYLSPGVVVPFSPKISMYAFVQLPLYQDVHGVQLAPRYTASTGIRYSF
jgi:hypothetical protein